MDHKLVNMFRLDKIDAYAKILESKNQNIDWTDFLDKNISHDDVYILKRIKSLLWVDKQLLYNTDKSNERWFRYYTYLINTYRDRIFVNDNTSNTQIANVIYILDIPDKIDENIPDTLIQIIECKICTLKRLLNIYNIKHDSIRSFEINNSCIMIPCASLLYPGIHVTKYNTIPDGVVALDENDLDLCRFRIIIELLTANNDIDIEKIISCNFGFIICNS